MITVAPPVFVVKYSTTKTIRNLLVTVAPPVCVVKYSTTKTIRRHATLRHVLPFTETHVVYPQREFENQVKLNVNRKHDAEQLQKVQSLVKQGEFLSFTES